MHRHNIIHRDLKPDNILKCSKDPENNELRIADFGLAKRLVPNELLSLKCGTPSYIAPEILRNQPYSFKADIFSVGSLMFNLVTGAYLFYGNQAAEVL